MRGQTMKYLLSAVLIVAALIAGKALVPAHAADLDDMQRTFGIIDLNHCSGSGQGPIDCPRDYYGQPPFGTFTEGYLKRKRERAEKRKQRPVKRGGIMSMWTAPQQCFDFDRDNTPRGFVFALGNPVTCRDLVQ